MVSRPVDSSIRSRQTGQVGSSIRAGVGGAWGFEERELEDIGVAWIVDVVKDVGRDLLTEGVKGSLVMSGNDGSRPCISCVWNSTDLTKTT